MTSFGTLGKVSHRFCGIGSFFCKSVTQRSRPVPRMSWHCNLIGDTSKKQQKLVGQDMRGWLGMQSRNAIYCCGLLKAIAQTCDPIITQSEKRKVRIV